MSKLVKSVNTLLETATINYIVEEGSPLIQCHIKLKNEWVIVTGESHCFDKNAQDVERGKTSAFNDAKSKLFDLEAYHLKRKEAEEYEVGNEVTDVL